jgi:uncharacterized protein
LKIDWVVYLFQLSTMKSFFQFRMNPRANAVICAILFWSLFVLLLLLCNPVAPIFGKQYSRLLYGVLGVCSALALTWLFLRFEKRSFGAIGLSWQPGTPGKFFIGLAIGSAIFGVILFALLALTPLQIDRNTRPIDSTAILVYLAFVPLSLMEEIVFRSYPFIKLHRRFGLRITQVIVAIAFALWHVIGGQSIFSSFLGPGVYAFVFGLAAVWSRGIALPFGIHVALNILQPLTGMRGDTGSVWTLNQKEPVVNWQMAAPDTVGLVMQLVVFVAAILLTEYYIRKKGNQWTQPEPAISIRSKIPYSLQADHQQQSEQTSHNSNFKK